MTPHLKQVGAHWKELSGAGLAVISALALLRTLVDEANKSVQGFNALPAWVQWLAFSLLVVVAIWLLVSAFARRSMLLRPERFQIRTETPEQLIGREKDLLDLITTCEKHRLVFLPGDSGSGKTALVKVGLLKTCQDSESRSRLLPVYIDASMLAWAGGLVSELRRALKLLSEDQMKALGTVHPTKEQSLADWIDGLPTDAARRLLVVIDQFDDYAIRYKDKLIDKAGLVINGNKLKKQNDDWLLLAKGIEQERLGLLFVCRDDMQWALTPVRFVEPAEKPPLPRLGSHWVAQLFERLTRDDGGREAVSDPSFGWAQLSKRLQQDLARDRGTVLAIQLVVGVEGLQHLRFLNVNEYQRQGGLTGLEQLHVMAEIENASRCGGLKLDPIRLLNALAELLVTEDGLKTLPSDQASLSASVLGEEKPAQLLKPAVDHLVAQRILRRHISAEGSEQLMLYHDFRARGIREAWLRANGSHELLRQHHAALDLALTFGQKWRALLNTRDQIQLAWARLRGRIRYGTYRRIALLSLVRTLPLTLLLVMLATGAWQWRLFGQRQHAERCLVFEPGYPSAYEIQKWTELAGLSEQARLHALEIGLKEQPSNIERRAEWIVHAVIGLDPGGRIQQRIADEILIPALKDSKGNDLQVIACTKVLDMFFLRNPAPYAAALVERMKREKNSFVLSALGSALSGMSDKLEAVDARPFAVALVERMKREDDSFALSALGSALSGMGDKLEAVDARPLAAALVERMKSEKDRYVLSTLGKALSVMSLKLEAVEVRTFAVALVERMKSEKDSDALSALGWALLGMSRKLRPVDMRPGAAVLAERMKSEKDSNVRSALGSALSAMSLKLEAVDVRPGAAALLERMMSEKSSDALLSLGWALSRMSDKLEAVDVRRFAAALLERMMSEKDSDSLSALGSALSGMCDKLEGVDVRTFAVALVERMKSEKDSAALSALGSGLSGMSAKLEAEDVRRFASALVERMKSERDSDALFALGSVLSGMSDKLDVLDVQRFAAALVERMNSEDVSFALSALGRGLAGMSAKLEAVNVRPGAAALLERMKSEANSRALSALGSALSGMIDKLEGVDVRPFAAALVERMKSEKDSYAFSTLGSALSGMSNKLEEEDVRPFAAVLLERMKIENNSVTLSALGEALSGMSGKLEAEDVRPFAAVLVERMKIEEGSLTLIALGSALSGLSAKLDAMDLRPGATALLERMKSEAGPGAGLVNAWLPLHKKLQPSFPARMADLINILQLPIAAGFQKEILEHIESQSEVAPTKFEGKVGKLTEWLETTERGKALKLNLDFRPH